MESLEKLRRIFGNRPFSVDSSTVLAIADEIEREIAERYLLLPVDANGVPIHPGDILDPPSDCDDYATCQVVKLTYDMFEKEWHFDGEAIGSFMGFCGYFDTAGWTHRKPRTVEDVLREFGDWYAHTKGGCDEDTVMSEYAAEIRELLGGGGR